MKVSELAQLENVSRRTIINWIHDGFIQAHKEHHARKTNAYIITGAAQRWLDDKINGRQPPPIQYGLQPKRPLQAAPIQQPPTTAEHPAPPPIRYVPIDQLEQPRTAAEELAEARRLLRSGTQRPY